MMANAPSAWPCDGVERVCHQEQKAGQVILSQNHSSAAPWDPEPQDYLPFLVSNTTTQEADVRWMWCTMEERGVVMTITSAWIALETSGD